MPSVSLAQPPLTVVELGQQPMQVDLATVRHDHVALESVDVDHADGNLLAGRCAALELAGVGSDEPAPRDAVRTDDQKLLDLVAAVRKGAVELPEAGAPRVQPGRRRTTDFDDYARRDQRVERRRVLVVHRSVEA